MALLAWPITLFALVFMYPWARWLVRRKTNPLLVALTTLALSVGALSLILFWLGLVAPPIDWRAAAGIGLLISLAGWIVLSRNPPTVQPISLLPTLHRDLAWLAVIVIAVIGALIVFNAVYWPLGIDDAIAIYGWYGKTIAQSGALPHGSLYETYPMLIPLSYAFTHQAAGWIDEHLAALIPALLSVGVLGVAYQLGSELFDRATGLSAALLLALAPPYAHWSSTGYADLPTAFFYGLSAVYLIRSRRTRSWPDALLAGIMAGLAAWTKNSALLIVLSIGLWVVYCWWLARSELPRPLSARDLGLIAVGFGAVCGPWYTRNLLLAGLIVPPTGWTWKAARTLENLFPYLQDGRYLLSGYVFTAGLAYALWMVWRSRGHAQPFVFLMLFFAPFFAIWWLLFSYDARFLLVLAPFVAVAAGHFVQLALARLKLIPLIWKRWQSLALVGLTILVALPAAWGAVDYKPELVRRPFMSEADKQRVRVGDRYDLGRYLSTLPPGSRILTQDVLLPYFVDGPQITVGGAPDAASLKAYQYWVASPGMAPPEWFGPVEALHSEGGYRVYAVPGR